MSGLNKNLSLTAFTKFDKGQPSGKLSGGVYVLQINPENISLSYDELPPNDDEPTSAAGAPISPKNAAYNKQTISLKFTIDNSGAIPNKPDKVRGRAGSSIKDSIDQLLKVTVKPTRASHSPPFVKLQWGKLMLVGKVFDLSIDYTYFNLQGDPVRADVSFTLVEEVDEVVISREFQSPDITRIITVKDGDSLIALSESSYDDPKYYLQIAAYNNLPSFRGLKIGSQIEIPPLEQ
jgi:nucleoid-associated protein YgaU